MNYHFFALHSRMKYINRWALMRNTQSENLAEHSNDVAVIAHAIAVIKNLRFGGELNAERVAFLALYHDMPEIMTGDMPTPVKYHSEKIHQAFLDVEKESCDKILSMLPDDLKTYYSDAFFAQDCDAYLWKIVKAADKISALIKCVQELQAGNKEFEKAYQSTLKIVNSIELEEVKAFMADFFESFKLSLDEQNCEF